MPFIYLIDLARNYFPPLFDLLPPPPLLPPFAAVLFPLLAEELLLPPELLFDEPPAEFLAPLAADFLAGAALAEDDDAAFLAGAAFFAGAAAFLAGADFLAAPDFAAEPFPELCELFALPFPPLPPAALAPASTAP
jgi:hypothetical protein